MLSRCIKGHKYAQVKVYEYVNGDETLISYSTPVIELKGGWITVNSLYSMTTIKHIGWYAREKGLSYQFMKTLYQEHKKYNIYTGEYADRE